MLFSYGAAARSSQQAVRQARAKGIKVGLLRPTTIWPFPDRIVTDVLKKCKTMLVAEISQGQLVYEVERVNKSNTPVVPVLRYDGEMITPAQILKAVEEAQI